MPPIGIGIGLGLTFGVTGGGAVPVNPNLFLQPGAGLYQDTGTTTPAASDGDVIGDWADQSGGGFNFTQATAANKPKYHPSRGTVEIELTYTSPPTISEEALANGSYSFDRNNGSLFLILEPLSIRQSYDGTSSNSYEVPFYFTTGTFTLNWAALVGVTNPGILAVSDGSFHYGTGLYVPTSRCLIGIVCSASATTYVVNGQTFTGSALASGVVSGGSLGILGTNANPYSGSVCAVVGYGRPLSAGDLAQMQTWAQSQGCVFDAPNNIVFDGDSITVGASCALNANFSRLLTFVTRPTMTNAALGGQYLSAMLTNRAAGIDVLQRSGRNNVLCVMGGTNDIYSNGDSAATVFGHLLSYCSGAKSAGWNKVVVATMLPRGGTTNETTRQTYNASIRSQVSPPWDAIADWGNDANMGQAGQNSNTTYFSADAVHPNPTGQAVGAGYVQAALASIGVV